MAILELVSRICTYVDHLDGSGSCSALERRIGRSLELTINWCRVEGSLDLLEYGALPALDAVKETIRIAAVRSRALTVKVLEGRR